MTESLRNKLDCARAIYHRNVKKEKLGEKKPKVLKSNKIKKMKKKTEKRLLYKIHQKIAFCLV